MWKQPRGSSDHPPCTGRWIGPRSSPPGGCPAPQLVAHPSVGCCPLAQTISNWPPPGQTPPPKSKSAQTPSVTPLSSLLPQGSPVSLVYTGPTITTFSSIHLTGRWRIKLVLYCRDGSCLSSGLSNLVLLQLSQEHVTDSRVAFRGPELCKQSGWLASCGVTPRLCLSTVMFLKMMSMRTEPHLFTGLLRQWR